MTADYTIKYQQLGAGEFDSGEETFLGYLESLNELEWSALLRDLLEHRARALNVVRPPRGDDPLAYAAQLFARLGFPTRRLIRKAVTRIIQRKLQEVRETEPSDWLGRAVSFSGMVHDVADPALLTSLVINPRVEPEVRFRAGGILTDPACGTPAAFWKNVDLLRHPELAPAVVLGLLEHTPYGALARLGELTQAPPASERLEYPLRLLMRKIKSEEKSLARLRSVIAQSPEWLVELITAVLGLDEFSEFGGSPMIDQYTPEVRRLEKLLDSILRGQAQQERWPVSAADFVYREAVGALIDGWQPFVLHTLDYSNQLLGKLTPDLLDIDDVTKLVSLLGDLAERLRRSAEAGGSEEKLLQTSALRVLELLGKAPVKVTLAIGEFKSVYSTYIHSLILAIDRRELSELALDQVARHAADVQKVVVAARAALAGEMEAASCHSIIKRHFSPRSCFEIFAAALQTFAAEGRPPLESRNEVLKIGAKLYSIDPMLIDKQSESMKLLVADAAVANSFSGWFHNIKDLIQQARAAA